MCNTVRPKLINCMSLQTVLTIEAVQRLEAVNAKMTSKPVIAKNIGSVIKLNDGVKMPLFGLGVSRMDLCDVETCVLGAFEQGYRLIDGAKFYE